MTSVVSTLLAVQPGLGEVSQPQRRVADYAVRTMT